jgi:hypothetical protein
MYETKTLENFAIQTQNYSQPELNYVWYALEGGPKPKLNFIQRRYGDCYGIGRS